MTTKVYVVVRYEREFEDKSAARNYTELLNSSRYNEIEDKLYEDLYNEFFDVKAECVTKE